MTNKRRDAIRRALPALLAACAVSLSGAACLDAYSHEVTDVRARQRWPWNNLVDIDYAISGATNQAGVAYSQEDALAAGLCLRFEMISDGVTNAVVLGECPPLTNGSHRVTWDPRDSGLMLFTASGAVCRAVLERHAPDTYLVIDLSGGASADSYPASYLPMPPGGGGWGDEYKTEKLVLRRVEPGTFQMGSPADEAGRSDNEDLHQVTLTRPFYIGVFEVTQRQYELVTGSICNRNYTGPGRPASGASRVMAEAFADKLMSATGIRFGIPTEAQWEYACRAGTTGAYNVDGATPATLCRYVDNVSDGRGGYTSGTTTAGSYTPNAWGLYDMHGNVWEWCADHYTNHLGSAAAVDPLIGPEADPKCVLRGGDCYVWSSATTVRSAVRLCEDPSKGATFPHGHLLFGFRAFCQAE